jgi:hypothetical protein
VWLLSVRIDLIGLYTDVGFYPLDGLRTLQSQDPLRFSLVLLAHSEPNVVITFWWIALFAAVCFTLGLATPVSGVVLWLLWISLRHRNIFATDGVQSLEGQLLFLLMLAPCGRVLSMDALWRPPAEAVRAAWPMMLQLIRLQICVVYFMSGWHKLMGRAWMDGSALLYPMLNPAWRHFDLDSILRTPAVVDAFKFITLGMVAWELLFWLLIAFRPTRMLALGIGVVMHLGQWLTVETGLFAPLMLASYIAFLDPRNVDTTWLRFTKNRAPADNIEESLPDKEPS